MIAGARAGFSRVLDLESKLLFKNSTWVFISNFAGIGLAFLRSVAVARILGAETFGAYAMVVAFVGIIQEFLNLNLGTAFIRFGAAYHHEGRIDKLTALLHLFTRTSLLMMVLSVAVVSFVTVFFYDVFITRPGLSTFVILYAAAASTKYFNSISNGILRLYYKFRLNSMIQIIMDIAESLLVIFTVWYFGNNLPVFFTSVILAAFLNGLICNAMAYWEVRHEFRLWRNSKTSLISDDIMSIRQFVLGNSVGNSLKSVMTQGDVLLLGSVCGTAQVAYYAVAKKLAYSVLVLTDPLVNSVFPQLSKLLAAKKFPEIRVMLKKITLTAAVPAILFLIPAYFLNEWVIVTIFGNAYSLAGKPFFWLLAGAVFGSVTFWALPLVQSLGLVGLRIRVYLAAIMAGASVAWWLLPSLEATGMAVALLSANLIINFTFIFYSWKKMRLQPGQAV